MPQLKTSSRVGWRGEVHNHRGIMRTCKWIITITFENENLSLQSPLRDSPENVEPPPCLSTANKKYFFSIAFHVLKFISIIRPLWKSLNTSKLNHFKPLKQEIFHTKHLFLLFYWFWKNISCHGPSYLWMGLMWWGIFRRKELIIPILCQ